jgi:predicted ATPase/DNA-binding CsgD family transcriptional regulator/transcriptional regulator with XRE-family HTH domain
VWHACILKDPTLVTPPFGEQLRQFRLRAGLSQEGLADRSGLTASAVGALELGTRKRPYPHTVGALADALGLSAEERVGFVAAASPPRHRGGTMLAARVANRAATRLNFRVPPTTVIGRAQESTDLRDLLAGPTGRLVTVTGVGGVGKTCLALRVAADVRGAFADGAWLVELAPVADPALVARATAAALGIPDVGGVAPLDAVVAFLEPKSLLLVLDNCEHVLDACAALAERLLARCPGVSVLATSREALEIVGERRLRLQPLSTPAPSESVAVDKLAQYPAIQLFLERSMVAAPDFRLTHENAPIVAQICAQVEGIPLALELAAARVRVLSVEQIAQRLDDALRLLSGGSRVAPSRQQTLIATLDWSRALLSEPEQAVFRRLGVFAGGCDLEAAESVCSGDGVDEADVLDLLARLVDRSLLVVEQRAATTRYRLLEPVRQYAQRQLADANEAASTRRRHAWHYLALAERAEPELHGPAQVAWQERLNLERDNLRAALRWAQECHEPETSLRLAVALAPFWERRGHLGEGRQWLSAALAAQPSRAIPSVLQAQAFVASGRLAQWQADLGPAAAFFERSLARFRDLRDERGMAESIVWLGTLRRRQAAYAEAVALLEDGLARCRALGDDRGAAFALLGLGLAVAAQGDPAQARSLLHDSLRLYRAVGDLRFVAVTQTMLGSLLLVVGELEQAAELLVEGLAGHRAVGDRVFVPHNLLGLAGVAALTDQPRLAARWLGAAEAEREAQGAALAPVNVVSVTLILDRIRARLSEPELEEAWSTGRRLTPDEIVADVTRDRAPTAVPPRPQAHTRARLTPREWDVARLVAGAQTDRQIAAALGIAATTASVHVHRVLAKLGLHSRWQVAEVLRSGR